MASAQVVETSVTNNSPSQDSNHPDDLFQSRYSVSTFKFKCSVVDGCSYFYSSAGILDSSGHIETQWICLPGKTKAHCSKESTGPIVSSRVSEPNRLHAKKLSRLPGLPRPTCWGETTRLPELSRHPELSYPPHVNGWYNFLNKWVEKYLAQGNSGEGLSRLPETI